jgi:hypothetical protein
MRSWPVLKATDASDDALACCHPVVLSEGDGLTARIEDGNWVILRVENTTDDLIDLEIEKLKDLRFVGWRRC